MWWIFSSLWLVHLGDRLSGKSVGWLKQCVILCEWLWVPGHPWSWLLLGCFWKLWVNVVGVHPCKWLPYPFLGHPWKWVQGTVVEPIIVEVLLVWGVVILWEIQLVRILMFASLQRFSRQLQLPLVVNHICWWVHLWGMTTRSAWRRSFCILPSRGAVWDMHASILLYL